MASGVTDIQPCAFDIIWIIDGLSFFEPRSCFSFAIFCYLGWSFTWKNSGVFYL